MRRCSRRSPPSCSGGRATGPPAGWTFAALLLYGFVLLLTMGISVPLNDRLAAAGDAASLADPAAVRERFAGWWVPVNVIRTLASTAALACLGRALLRHGQRR